MLHALYTPAGEYLTQHPELIPWDVCHPRPQMQRDTWLNLNGYWDFAVSPHGNLPETYDRKIRLPFAPESLLSGIGEHFPEGSYLFYTRRIELPETFTGKRVLLHIGAADQVTDVYVNGHPVGHHEGGYTAMTFDITDALSNQADRLTIRVRDDLRDQTFPYGKQTTHRGGMWYTPVSGIWQTVWLEPVPQEHISGLEIHATPEVVTVSLTGAPLSGIVTIHTPQGTQEVPLCDGVATYHPESPRLWSPEDPYLYWFTITAGEDRVYAYFAIRTLEIKTVGGIPRLCLNGEPYFFHGLLDQGYWSDGLFTPATPEGYYWDILTMKNLGFNTLRKHIKIEDPQFYYHCDALGMIVFQDMVNNGHYSFLRDTALPTIGIQRLPDKAMHKDNLTRQRFLSAMDLTVRQLKNHPCICCWTIFNEGWGQFDSSAVYSRLLELDDTRFIDSTSGWFRCGQTQVDSRHIYFRNLQLKPSDKPLILSEFGGYSWKPEGHVFNDSSTYGYGKFPDRKTYGHAVEALYLNQLLPLIKTGLCGAIYTQLSDVEDETNGLVSFDRRVEKLQPERMQAISQALFQAFSESLQTPEE